MFIDFEELDRTNPPNMALTGGGIAAGGLLVGSILSSVSQQDPPSRKLLWLEISCKVSDARNTLGPTFASNWNHQLQEQYSEFEEQISQRQLPNSLDLTRLSTRLSQFSKILTEIFERWRLVEERRQDLERQNQDREAQERRAQDDREAEERRAQDDREAEERRAQDDRNAQERRDKERFAQERQDRIIFVAIVIAILSIGLYSFIHSKTS